MRAYEHEEQHNLLGMANENAIPLIWQVISQGQISNQCDREDSKSLRRWSLRLFDGQT